MSNDELRWNFDSDEIIRYEINISGRSVTSERLFVVLGEPQIIPDNITSFWDVTYSNVSYYWENGTSIFRLIPPGCFVYVMAYPTGNWSYISELAAIELNDTNTVEFEIIDTENEWGYTKLNDNVQTYTRYTRVVSKTDGLLLRSESHQYYADSGATVSYKEVRRIADLPLELIAGLSITGVVIIALSVGYVVIKKKSGAS
jgi:hypothetical protein